MGSRNEGDREFFDRAFQPVDCAAVFQGRIGKTWIPMLQRVDSLGNCLFRKPAHLGNPRVERFYLFFEYGCELLYHRRCSRRARYTVRRSAEGGTATSAIELPMQGAKRLIFRLCADGARINLSIASHYPCGMKLS